MQRPIISVMLFWTLLFFNISPAIFFLLYSVTQIIALSPLFSNFWRKNFCPLFWGGGSPCQPSQIATLVSYRHESLPYPCQPPNLQYHFGIEFLSPRTNRPRSVTVRFFFAAYTNIPPSPLKTLLALLASLLRTFALAVSILRQQDMRNAEVRFSDFATPHRP